MEKFDSLISNDQPFINDANLEIVTSIYNYYDVIIYGYEINALSDGIVILTVIISYIQIFI